jgi:hypothetical protein
MLPVALIEAGDGERVVTQRLISLTLKTKTGTTRKRSLPSRNTANGSDFI